MRKAEPHTIILGPGSVGEGGGLTLPPSVPFPKTEALLQAAGPVFDAFCYHFYGAVSERCAALGAGGTTPAAALSNDWLSRTDKVEAFYAALRDRFEPGRPLWITETADAACGGNPWAATFLDSFRYLNQLGTLARRGVQVVMHNTLNASDYGLLDEKTLEPRPNYWAALLWRRLMGTTVLDPGASHSTNLHLYAQCERHVPGGVTLLAINADRTRFEELSIAGPANRYTLTAPHLQGKWVRLNGKALTLGKNDALPALTGVSVRAGNVTLAPASITFFTFGKAGNTACK